MGKPSHPGLCCREDVCASSAGVEGRLDLIAVCLSVGRSQVFLFSLFSGGSHAHMGVVHISSGMV